MGTVRLSDKLHNKGLERLKAGDFYHGIDALTKSVSINKNNVPSRNMLGLALFEVGHVGDALKHWVISQSMMNDDNPAAKYIEATQKNARQLERLSDAVEMYNQALGHIKQKSDDLAIIQLKKAVEINPRFVDALNLLTLCYLIQNDRDRANAAAERVLAIDALNPIALNYYSILNPNKKPPRVPTARPKNPQKNVKGPYKAIGLEEKKQKNFHFAELFTFLIGVAVTAVAGYFLFLPAINDSHRDELNTREQDLAAAQARNAEREADLEDVIEERDTEISIMGETLHERSATLDRQRRINQALLAYLAFRAVDAANNEDNFNALLRVVDMLDGFDGSDLPPDIIQMLDNIAEGAHPRLGVSYYNLGLASFNANPRDSFMALNHLENAQRFLTNEAAQWNRMLFMLGTLYLDEENFDDAYEVLDELRERAPGLPSGAPSNFSGAERTAFNNMIARLEERR
jgi:tetratricopeptide (TPR) repeat protein